MTVGGNPFDLFFGIANSPIASYSWAPVRKNKILLPPGRDKELINSEWYSNDNVPSPLNRISKIV
jgi:hypothetical protein